MQQQQTEFNLVSWIEMSRLFAVRTDSINMAVILSYLLRNLTFNRSAHCTQVSDQCPLGLLFFCLNKGHNFLTISHRDFIFGMFTSTPLMKLFQMIPRSTTLWPFILKKAILDFAAAGGICVSLGALFLHKHILLCPLNGLLGHLVFCLLWVCKSI